MISLLLLSALASAADSPGTTAGHGWVGLETPALGEGAAIGLSETIVAGGDGGVAMTGAQVRWASEKNLLLVRLPFASYNTPGGRDAAFGNLRVEWLSTSKHKAYRGNGLALWLPTGNAWTWGTRADDLWRGGGAAWVLQRQYGEDFVWSWRTELGIGFSTDYAPMTPVWLVAGVTVAADLPLVGPLGLVGEADLRVYDTSPIDLTALARLDAGAHVRVRGGLSLPIAAWAGGGPSERPAGVRETVLRFDVSVRP